MSSPDQRELQSELTFRRASLGAGLAPPADLGLYRRISILELLVCRHIHSVAPQCTELMQKYLCSGEVDAKSKFLGKSFEIRPTGVAHADLILPSEWGPSYPASQTRPGFVREHYSWKKVTTSISGFVMGAPQIDHYGDMEVTNHRTGERCVLTFKPKGWRGKDACEVKGSVYTADGELAWELAGRWNGQLGELHTLSAHAKLTGYGVRSRSARRRRCRGAPAG